MARIELMTIPPRAIPNRIAMKPIGAAKNSSRFPCAFSQYSWPAIIQTTFSQNEVNAPPRTTNPMYCGGACSAR